MPPPDKAERASSSGASEETQHDGHSRTAKQRAKLWYRLYFEELVLRRKSLAASKDGRRIPLNLSRQNEPLVDERRGHAYISNSIRSSRYTLWDFLPKQFFFQATRLSNFYFICIGVPQAIPGFSTTGSYTTILPVGFFILLTILKEGYDDYRRHRLDTVENLNWATVLQQTTLPDHGAASPTLLARTNARLTGLTSQFWSSKSAVQETIMLEQLSDDDTDDHFQWSHRRWCHIRVGDIVKLSRDDPVPADVVLLSASGENGAAYIETMALDGETNLKPKQAPSAFVDRCRTISGLRQCSADFVLEDPNPNLYNFTGKATIDGQVLPLTLNEIVYRGSVLRNTATAIGLVINTGEECKIRMNANHHASAKTPRLERYANQVVLTLIAYVIILSVGVSAGYLIWHKSTEQHSWYLNNAYVPFQQIIVGFLIMFNNVIPLALYVSLEIVKIGQMFMIQSDVLMYDEASNTPMICNTNTILENLGQVSYLLSDKTGTLTENVMRFRGMSIGGIVWMHRAAAKESPASLRPAESGKAHDAKTTTTGRKSVEPNNAKPTMEHTSHLDGGIEIQEHEISITPGDEIPQPGTMKPRPSLSRGPSRSHSVRLGARTTSELLDLIRQDPHSTIACKAREFILGMALCHMALPEAEGEEADFQAPSPDELALLRAARDLGVLLYERSTEKMTLLVTHGTGNTFQETYQILDVVEFSSKRKRMSIVVRKPDDTIWLICKGADSAIIPRLRQAELASRKSVEVRRSMDIERHLQRKGEQHEPRNSFGARPSLNIRGRSSLDIRVSLGRPTLEVPRASHDRCSINPSDESAVFRRCFQHIDDFATDGLRTLLFAYKQMDEDTYQMWKKQYSEASTSLVDRQERIEAAGELVEQGLDLLGASAIEDKLQKGVPETIDKLRRANIRIWMLTGDKRETAINIAHAARICQPTSLIYILDSTKGDLHGQMSEMTYDLDVHQVVVIDGHTLGVVAEDADLKQLFYGELITKADSVIVCRASPAQKADMVKGIRARLPGLTLSIGDGANDVAMIQASHVGVGISGKEGLQAARVADFSIAQFRFLQRLLLVHGRYQYMRTAKFILWTFWKEMFFYMMQALYQKYNGYSGTSLYEMWSLTVLNTLFTSLCVIIPGIFEKDLQAETLLAVPELYVYGQRNQGLNLPKYALWMVLAAADGIIVWFVTWAAYGSAKQVQGDNGLFALGDLSFTMGILWTNWKIFILETNYKTSIVLGGFAITVAGWWIWNLLLAGIYMNNLSPYDIKHGFIEGFGREPAWWLALIIAFLILSVMEMVWGTAKRQLQAQQLWPPWKRRTSTEDVSAENLDLEIWQELERDPCVMEQLSRLAEDDLGDDEDEAAEENRADSI